MNLDDLPDSIVAQQRSEKTLAAERRTVVATGVWLHCLAVNGLPHYWQKSF